MASGAAKRYTEAVFDIAREKGSFDQWQRDAEPACFIQPDRMSQRSFLSPVDASEVGVSTFGEILENVPIGIDPFEDFVERIVGSSVEILVSVKAEFRFVLTFFGIADHTLPVRHFVCRC